MLKKRFKKFAQRLGINISKISLINSPDLQLAKVLDLAGVDLVFDIGANQGQFAIGLRESGYKGKIVSFEPLSSARKGLSRFSSEDSSWLLHEQSAIGDYDGVAKINVSENSFSSSILEILDAHSAAAPDSKYIDSETVPIARIDSIVDKYLQEDSSLFLKIDTQGFEWEVLEGAAQTLKQVCGVLCELSLVPLYEGQRLWLEIIECLESKGFSLWACQKGFTDPRTGQTLQMDCIFVRRDVLKKIYASK